MQISDQFLLNFTDIGFCHRIITNVVSAEFTYELHFDYAYSAGQRQKVNAESQFSGKFQAKSLLAPSLQRLTINEIAQCAAQT
jgi:hypothetical protein